MRIGVLNPARALLDQPPLSKGSIMQIPKDQTLSLLKGQGDDDTAQKADGELPDTVDTDEHAGMLSKLGL